MKLTVRLDQVLRSLAVALVCAASMSACAPKQPPAPTPLAAAVAPPRPTAVAECRLEGCCRDHGEVAYLQRDLAVICTDGTASTICDCHM